MITTQEGHTITVTEGKINILFNNKIEAELKLTDSEMLDLALAIADIRDKGKKPAWRK